MMKAIKKTWILGLALAGFSLAPVSSSDSPAHESEPILQVDEDSYEDLRAKAEAYFNDGSYELARRTYAKAQILDLDEFNRRWVEFRLADAGWRSAASTEDQDDSVLRAARATLEELAPLSIRKEDRDRVWVEVQESLGDLLWDRLNSQDWSGARPRYGAALEWWGAARDVDLARERYLGMIWRMVQPRWYQRSYGHRIQPNWIDRDLLENAVKIARGGEDIARASLYLGLHYRQQGQNSAFAGRGLRALTRAIELSEGTEWRDDAIFSRGQFLENIGRAERDEEGQWQWNHDYSGALADYRRILTEFSKGETPWFDEARQRAKNITATELSLVVDRFFLPDSLALFQLSWRNVSSIELSLHRVSLVDDPLLRGTDDLDWLAAMDLNKREALRTWRVETEDSGEHKRGTRRETIEGQLAPGAYVLVARAGGEVKRELVLVGDLAVTVKVMPNKVLAWTTDAISGRPIAFARVKLWQRWYDGNTWRIKRVEAKTGADGIAILPVVRTENWSNWFLAAQQGSRQAYAASSGSRAAGRADEWQVHTQTDRPAYRPGESVNWRFLARRRSGGKWSTPASERLRFEVRDARGEVVSRGVAELNAYGAAWGSFDIPEEAALGEFQARFFNQGSGSGSGNQVATATLIRLEEYKLPEFEVGVTTLDPTTGEPRAIVVGDRLEFDVEATYYYGAPVQNATVQVLVYQKPWWFRWQEEREFSWLQEQNSWGRQWWGGPGQQVLSVTVTTDAAGRARVSLDTPMDANSDLEYTVEARVTDASRREVVGTGSVRVTRQEFYARAKLEHSLYQPGGKVEVLFETRDPNGNPVGTKGLVRVMRQRYVEVWNDPLGQEWRGRDRFRLLGPIGHKAPSDARAAGWSLMREGYEEEEVAITTLETLPKTGEARWSFTPPREGTYRVRWIGRDSRRVPVNAEVVLWVCGDKTTELGYRPGNLELLLDEDTVAPGGQAVAVLTAPSSNRWVLFTVEGETLFEHRVIHLAGSVKLVRVDVGEQHTPNIWLNAVMVADGQAWMDTKELIVPPLASLLNVTITPEQESYEPGAEGKLLVTVRDSDGKPVQVELALAVYDRALEAIQSDLSPNPARFFHGKRQVLRVQLAGSFQMRSLARLREDKSGVIDEFVFNQPLGEPAALNSRFKKERGFYSDRDDAYGGLLERQAGLRGMGYAASPGDSLASRSRTESSESSMIGGAGGGGGGGPQPQVRIRSDFRKTALWLPSIQTDAEGQARIRVPFPDSTTRWRAVARGVDTGVRVGQGEADVSTRQPLIARLQAPRFLQVDDELTISGNLMNGTDQELMVRAVLEVEGADVLGLYVDGKVRPLSSVPFAIPARGEVRVDWRLAATLVGDAKLRLVAIAESGETDGMEMKLPIVARGIDVLVALSGRMDGDGITATLSLPSARTNTALEIQVTPSLAVTMLDALPYLVDYPYGCVEQTLSRFLPTVIALGALDEVGLSREEALTRVFGGVEERFRNRTHPEGKQALRELDRMVADGLKRLYDMQHADGGWGWWKTGDSDLFMTAYVLWGLSIARDADVDIRTGVLANAANWLALELVEAENQPDLGAWMLHALGAWGGELDAQRRVFVDAAYMRLEKTERTRMNAYTRALLALACNASGRDQSARRLLDNLMNGVKIDNSPDTSIISRAQGESQPYVLATAHWGSDGIWRRWSEGPVEATATALRALLAIQPDHELVEPVTNWLVKNRRGAQWSNTRDTAMAVLALTKRLRSSGELSQRIAFEVSVNGVVVGERDLSPADLLGAAPTIEVDPSLLRDGKNEVTIRRTAGEAPLYFAAYARFFDSSRPIEAHGNEVFVRRQYYRLAPRETLLSGTVYDRIPLEEGGVVRSGERIEVVLTIEAKNDLEYLLLEDLKPAGFEAVGLQSGSPAYAVRLKVSEAQARFNTDSTDALRRRSGYARDPLALNDSRHRGQTPGTTGETRWAHQELRDRKVAHFLDRLPEGFWEVRYELRAEVPGSFVALPVIAEAMYVPEIRSNGIDQAILILDRETVQR